MYSFVVVDGFPFLLSDGKFFKVRWDETGFTIGEEVKLKKIPSVTYNEHSIKTKCTVMNSIDPEKDIDPEKEEPEKDQTEQNAEEPEQDVIEDVVEGDEKPKRRTRRKAE